MSFEHDQRPLDIRAATLEPDPLDFARSRLDRAIVTYYDDLAAALRRRGAEPSQAAEIIHDLYIQLSRKPEALDGARSLRALLIRAAANLGIDRARRRAFETRLFAMLDTQSSAFPAAAATPETEAAAAIDAPRRVAALRRAIQELPPQRRAAFIAWRLGAMSKDEIAERLGVSRGMVNRHLRKALLHCMDRVEEIGRE